MKNVWLKISFQILIFFLHTNFVFAQNNSNVAKAYVELRKHHKKNLLPRFHRILNDKDKIILKLKQDLLAYQSKPDFGLKCRDPEDSFISMWEVEGYFRYNDAEKITFDPLGEGWFSTEHVEVTLSFYQMGFWGPSPSPDSLGLIEKVNDYINRNSLLKVEDWKNFIKNTDLIEDLINKYDAVLSEFSKQKAGVEFSTKSAKLMKNIPYADIAIIAESSQVFIVSIRILGDKYLNMDLNIRLIEEATPDSEAKNAVVNVYNIASISELNKYIKNKDALSYLINNNKNILSELKEKLKDIKNNKKNSLNLKLEKNIQINASWKNPADSQEVGKSISEVLTDFSNVQSHFTKYENIKFTYYPLKDDFRINIDNINAIIMVNFRP